MVDPKLTEEDYDGDPDANGNRWSSRFWKR